MIAAERAAVAAAVAVLEAAQRAAGWALGNYTAAVRRRSRPLLHCAWFYAGAMITRSVRAAALRLNFIRTFSGLMRPSEPAPALLPPFPSRGYYAFGLIWFQKKKDH